MSADASPPKIVLSFDNLGEAADEQRGLPIGPGPHYSVTDVLPTIVSVLDAARLKATFFVEAVNAERYPQALADLLAAGHEIGCHGWRHETFGALPAERKPEILRASISALERAGANVNGFRPPGGILTTTDLQLLGSFGFTWASPAGDAMGEAHGVICLPFRWPLIDAYFMAPALAPLRARAGLPEPPMDVDAFISTFDATLGDFLEHPEATPLCVIVHPFLYSDAERFDALAHLLRRLGELNAAGTARVAPGAEVAAGLHASPTVLPAPVLDSATWTSEQGPASS